MSIIRKIPWHVMPPSGARINWASPYTRDLLFLGPNQGYFDLTERLKAQGTPGSTLGRAVTPFGLGFNNPDNDNAYVEWAGQQIVAPGDDSPITMMFYGAPVAETFPVSMVSQLDNAGAFPAGALLANTANTLAGSIGRMTFALRVTGTNQTNAQSDSTTVIDGNYHWFAGSGTPGSTNDVTLYRDGVVLASTANTSGSSAGWAASTQSFKVGGSAEATANSQILGPWLLAAVWTRKLTDAEVSALHKDFFQLMFLPRTMRIGVQVGGTLFTFSPVGSMTPSGSLATASTFASAVSGATTMTGALIKRTGKLVSGSVTLSGAVSKLVDMTMAGSIALSGTVTKLTDVTRAGSITMSGALASTIVYLQTVTGSTTLSGAISKMAQKIVAGSTTLAGSILKLTSVTRSGSISASGDVTKETQTTTEGSTTPQGDLSTQVTLLQTIAGALTGLAGALTANLVLPPTIASAVNTVRGWLHSKVNRR